MLDTSVSISAVYLLYSLRYVSQIFRYTAPKRFTLIWLADFHYARVTVMKFHTIIYASCFSAMMWGKLSKTSVIVTSVIIWTFS